MKDKTEYFILNVKLGETKKERYKKVKLTQSNAAYICWSENDKSRIRAKHIDIYPIFHDQIVFSIFSPHKFSEYHSKNKIFMLFFSVSTLNRGVPETDENCLLYYWKAWNNFRWLFWNFALENNTKRSSVAWWFKFIDLLKNVVITILPLLLI